MHTPRATSALVVFVLAGAFLLPSGQASGTILFSNTFQGSPWTTAWHFASTGTWGLQNLVVGHDASQFPTFLRATYPKGSCSPACKTLFGAPLGGGGFKATMGLAPRDAIHLRYDVRFPVGFAFVKGGKLPGLYGGTGPSGGTIPTGADGWSTRFMWRAGGAGEVYAYLPTSQTWGSSLGAGAWHFNADGKWHAVEQEVRMNTPGSSNGVIKVWYDGKLVYQTYGVKFRTVSTLHENGVMFSTFFGGQDRSWASPWTQHVDFAHFAVSGGYVGP